jgi:hypothetical protein
MQTKKDGRDRTISFPGPVNHNLTIAKGKPPGDIHLKNPIQLALPWRERAGAVTTAMSFPRMDHVRIGPFS